jgi:hypothetical protein
MGWYEWKEIDRVDPTTGEIRKGKEPHFIYLPRRQPVQNVLSHQPSPSATGHWMMLPY